MPTLFTSEERFEYLKQYGSHCLAYSTLQPGMEYFDVPGVGYLAYMTYQGQRFVLGEPICSENNKAELIAQTLSSHPNTCFVQASLSLARHLSDFHGYRATHLGVETEIQLPHWSPAGRNKVMIRNNRNQAFRSGIQIIECSNDPAMYRQMAALSEKWLTTRRINKRQMAFLARPLNGHDENDVRCFAAFHNSVIVGFTLFDPMFHNGKPAGYHPDITRFDAERRHGFYYTIILEALNQFRADGISCLNLGLSPLSRRTVASLGSCPLTNAFLWLVYRFGNRFYNFRGIEYTKSRFRGAEKPVYCCHRSRFPLRETFRIFRLCHVI